MGARLCSLKFAKKEFEGGSTVSKGRSYQNFGMLLRRVYVQPNRLWRTHDRLVAASCCRKRRHEAGGKKGEASLNSCRRFYLSEI